MIDSAYDVMPEKSYDEFDLVVSTSAWIPISEKVGLEIMENKHAVLGLSIPNNRFTIKVGDERYPVQDNMILLDSQDGDFVMSLYSEMLKLATCYVIWGQNNDREIKVFFKAVVV